MTDLLIEILDGDGFIVETIFMDAPVITEVFMPGPRGPQGLKGDQGDQGIQGIQGVKGDQGDQGIQGIQGIQGLKGDKGDKGDQGDVGPQGSFAPEVLAAILDPLIVGAITRDANNAATSANLIWPDGDLGVYTATDVNVDFPGAVDGYTVTKVTGGVTVTYTQPPVTRNVDGAVTNRPAITVS